MKHLQLSKSFLSWLGIDMEVNSDDEVYILEQKGKTMHLLLLAMVFAFSLLLTIINLLSQAGPAALSFIPAPLTVVCLLLYKKGYITASKLLNFFQVSIVIAAIVFIETPVAGHLTFYIPTAVGAQIMFAGKDRRLAHGLCLFVIALLIWLIATVPPTPPGSPHTLAELRCAWNINFIGAMLAVLVEITFILSVSNRIQGLLIRRKQQMAVQNQELQRTNEELDRFVYAVSHDLRTPLVSLKGLLDLTMRLPLAPEKAVSYLQMAATSTNRLDDTIRDILEYARNARLEPVAEPFDLLQLAKQVFADHSFAAERPIKLVLAPMEGSSLIVHDKTRIQVLLRNLIGNAIKYASKQVAEPHVAIWFGQENNQLLLEISDNGEGIAPNCLPKIFDMFFRGTSSAEGTGLGLYICKQIVTKLDGEITVQSQLGEGTTVRVRLPIEKKEAE